MNIKMVTSFTTFHLKQFPTGFGLKGWIVVVARRLLLRVGTLFIHLSH